MARLSSTDSSRAIGSARSCCSNGMTSYTTAWTHLGVFCCFESYLKMFWGFLTYTLHPKFKEVLCHFLGGGQVVETARCDYLSYVLGRIILVYAIPLEY